MSIENMDILHQKKETMSKKAKKKKRGQFNFLRIHIEFYKYLNIFKLF